MNDQPLDASRMFLDWCPLPKRVMRIPSIVARIPVWGNRAVGITREVRIELALFTFHVGDSGVQSLQWIAYEPTSDIVFIQEPPREAGVVHRSSFPI